jgi:hypothetical protein
MKNNKIAISVLFIAILIVGYAVIKSFDNENPTVTEVNNNVENNTPVIETESEVLNEAEETVTEEETIKETEPIVYKFIDQKAPFTSQAPTGDWDDERQQDGCEEASALMAVYWAQGKSLNSSTALREILGSSDYTLKEHGEFRDISVDDTVNWIFKEYFKFNNVAAMKDVTLNDIILEIQKGNVIVAPMNGQLLGNPYFTPPGPERHMLLIRGYDPAKKQFITNDPGTKRGEAYRYDEDVLFNAILSYSTGYHVPVTRTEKDIIVVSK